VGISRSGFYYEPLPESAENLSLMRRLTLRIPTEIGHPLRFKSDRHYD
jgi:hypothetical protein